MSEASLDVPDLGSERLFALAMAVNALGNGGFATISALYFTKVAGMSIPALGLALAVAGGAGLMVGPVVGRLSDRVSAKWLYVALLVIQGVGVFAYSLPVAYPVIAALLMAVVVAERGAAATRGTFIGRLVGRSRRVTYRARVRAITNGTAAIGAALGSLVLVRDSPDVYRWGVWANAATFLVAAALILACTVAVAPPRTIGAASGDVTAARPTRALSDRPFLAVTGLNAVLLLHGSMLTLAFPLWISQYTAAPLWMVSALVLLNTVGVVLLQVRCAKGVHDMAAAGAASRRSALLLASSCVVVAGAAMTEVAWLAGAVLLAAAALHLGGELFQAAAGWTFAFEMAPEENLGEYQGVFNAGQDTGQLVSPVVFTTMIALGAWSWLALALVFVAVGGLFGPATRVAIATRPRGVDEHA